MSSNRCMSRNVCRSQFMQAGFSLVEVMITVVIVAVLAMVALPVFQKQIAKGRRADAIGALSTIVQAQERLRSNRGSYASTMEDAELAKLAFANNLTPKRHYQLSLVGLGNPPDFTFGFIARAAVSSDSPQANDSDCATMFIQLRGGNMSYGATDSAGSDSSRKCWPR
ncbi:type IV pilin protein [Paucibacter sp. KCTC 42545]|uniref:type IV pilin protein n=1 Tax=Paucibacter sp. KCTC 42545 TaxID=1768242 RepID=UPI0009EB5217|nr:type IV pilin protein [Paucibacter sp. KCTC 42545]